jgi:membrane associated rhomboid family serine protease
MTLLPLGAFTRMIEMPALLFLGLWAVFYNLAPALAQAGTKVTSGIAFWAHLGGALAGAVLIGVLRPSGHPAPPRAPHHPRRTHAPRF